MKFDLSNIYHITYGKKARPFDDSSSNRGYPEFIYSSILSSAYEATQAKEFIENYKFINTSEVTFIHMLLYYMKQAGIGLDNLHDIIMSSNYFSNLQNIDKYLYKNYCTDKLFRSIKDEDIWTKYFNDDDYCDDLQFVPTHFILKTWPMNDFLTGLLKCMNYKETVENQRLIGFIEDAYLLQITNEQDYDDWAEDELLNNGLNPYDIFKASEDMLNDIDYTDYSLVRDAYISNNKSKKISNGKKNNKKDANEKKPYYPVDDIINSMNNKIIAQEQSVGLLTKTSQRIDKRTKIKNIESLPSYVVGQDEATKIIADKILGAFVGFHHDKEPVASFLLTGPTGVGKTETAKAVANLCCDGNIHVVDMSTFKNKIDISRLIGASPNYVGYGDKIPFCDFIKEHPNGVILFDEGEKAHPECLDVIMRMLDEAEFITAKGEKLSLKDNIIFFTSNYTATNSTIGFGTDDVSAAEKMTSDGGIRKEIIGRFNNVIEYKPLSEEACKQIAIKFIEKKIEIFKSNNTDSKINLSYTDDLLTMIIKDANTKLLGARDLKKSIDKLFIAPISEYIIKNNPDDVTIVVTSNGIECNPDSKLLISSDNINTDDTEINNID